MTDDLLTVDAVAARVGVTPLTVKTWLRAGKLRGTKPGGTRVGWRIRASDLDAYLDENANRPATVRA